ncbi:MAG: cytochrome c1 [Thiotrichales bacterium]
MKILSILLVLVLPLTGFAAGPSVPLDRADIDLGNQASLQRGLKNFVNYCMGCHSAAYSRFNRVGRDLGIDDEQMAKNLIFTTDEVGEQKKVGDLMKVVMTKRYAKEAFGIEPPDLSLVARSRGADWLYTYLRTFYLDDSRPMGVNNLVFPGVGMPHVMWELQGWQVKQVEAVDDGRGHKHEKVSLVLATPGTMTPSEFDGAMRDLTNFLVYLAEPYKLQRQQWGVIVMLFLAGFAVLAYFLKKEYWKDVH